MASNQVQKSQPAQPPAQAPTQESTNPFTFLYHLVKEKILTAANFKKFEYKTDFQRTVVLDSGPVRLTEQTVIKDVFGVEAVPTAQAVIIDADSRAAVALKGAEGRLAEANARAAQIAASTPAQPALTQGQKKP